MPTTAKHNLLINVDWLQLHVDASDFTFANGYTFEQLPIASRTFAEIWNISKNGRPVGQLQRVPHSPKIPKGCGTFKFENYILYCSDRRRIIDQVLNDCKLYTRGITRIDICGDFTRIAHEYPHKVIQAIIEEKIYKVGHAKIATSGNYTEPTFTIHGTSGRANQYSYLRYGSRSSRISAYLYNKTKELNEVHDKPYIREMWRNNGWTGKHPVWRLEYSIKGHDMKFISRDTGEIWPNNPKLWLSPDVTRLIYSSCCQHYFDLRVKTQVRKDREQPIILWDELGDTLLIKHLDSTRHSNRADKIFLRKLANMKSETDNAAIINAAAELGRAYAKEKHLGSWMSEQGILLRNVDYELFNTEL